MVLFNLFLKFIYLFIKLFPKSNKVTFLSRQSNEPSVDMKMLANIYENRGFEVIILCKELENGFLNSILYFFHIIESMYHISTSKICIIEGYIIPISVLNHKKDTLIIQLWHALGAIKKFGYETIDKTSGTSKGIALQMKMHKNYDYVLSSSTNLIDIYARSFNVKSENILLLGMPRIDYILNDENKDYEIFIKYPSLKNKINILYAPTFRKNKTHDLTEEIKCIDFDRYNLIIKKHPLDKTDYKTYNDKIIIDDNFHSFDWIKIVDKIILDYSALAIEASLLNKEIFFYVYDYDEYKIDPGLNFDMLREMPDVSSKCFYDVIEKIEKYDYDLSIVKKFREKYVNIEIDNCCEKIVNFTLKEINSTKSIYAVEDLPQRIPDATIL